LWVENSAVRATRKGWRYIEPEQFVFFNGLLEKSGARPMIRPRAAREFTE